MLLEYLVKILVDENIPYATKLFGRLGDVESIPGRKIQRDLLVNVKALMVRSVTKVNAELLYDSCVKFVGTATSGIDHVDETLLYQRGIGFSSAPGCNAIAVVEYVFCALLVLAERQGFQLRDKTIGIIGVGNIGSCLDMRLQALGVRTLLCDPPRAARGEVGEFLSLEKLVAEADVLTFHTPLNNTGPHLSWHLVDADMLAALPNKRILINTCRGSVVDNVALLQSLEKGKKISTVIDVWEFEPNLLPLLLARVDIGTAHIAGYTLEGRVRGTTQLFESYSSYLGKPQEIELATLLPIAEFSYIHINGTVDESKLKRLMHLVYNVQYDDSALRNVVSVTSDFDRLRKDYPNRREWSSLRICCNDSASADLLIKLGFNVL